MSGRERLRHGWLRFGKVRRKPNKDGKNRLCLEKNRCREEEEFPVVKGISKRVIVVKSPDPKVFEQAIFIIREDFAGQSGISEKDVLRQARAAAEEEARKRGGTTVSGTRMPESAFSFEQEETPAEPETEEQPGSEE